MLLHQRWYGLGKTTVCRNYIETLQAQDRVLFVSTRRAFGYSQKGDYKCGHYKDEREDRWDDDHFICQYESLHHWFGRKRYNVIVLDETRSLMSNMACTTTNSDKLKMNADMLKFLMEQADTVLCLDAHLEFDASVTGFLQSDFPSRISCMCIQKILLTLILFSPFKNKQL